ncbi:hypothetical protein BDZ89DRAFT_1100936 [Hymenopellis radicata]|nr:hypothetical protein BDZ89DRAFT_1100936 [Hymenopellis radicata]
MTSSVPSSSSTVSRCSEAPSLTTAASSPSPETDITLDATSEVEATIELDDEVAQKYAQLTQVLEKSMLYSGLLYDQLKATTAQHQAAQVKKLQPRTSRSQGRIPRRGRKRAVESESEDEAPVPKKPKLEDYDLSNLVEPTLREEDRKTLPQPALITGATLKDYQIEGLQWMVSLHQNGISGILADEMGLGKTLQTISFSAYLRESNYGNAFLIVCPLSVLHNWVEEYAKFAPDIPVCMYHGTPEERANLRNTVLSSIPRSKQANSKDSSTPTPAKASSKRKTRGRRTARKSAPKKEEPVVDDVVMPDTEKDEEDAKPPSFPIVVTTFEMIMKDRAYLASYNWGYIVVDEGHRLKNLDSKLMRELKKYNNASRMILTGTPLHNNLAELWALLNFVLPDIFTDVEQFEEWFSLPTMKSNIGSKRSTEIIDTLHTILKPFLLRRLKADVETNLPPKKEYVLYAPLSVLQRETYDRVLDGSLRSHLIRNRGYVPAEPIPVKLEVDINEKRTLRSKKVGRPSYVLEDDDDEYFDMLARGDVDDKGRRVPGKTEDLTMLGQEHQRIVATKQVNNMKLQNTVMQLRKVCSHPYLFDWPLDPRTHDPILDHRVVSTSGKMMVLERLLDELFRRKHKVLLFSQFTTVLDIIDDWARELKGWNICRIDGSTAPLQRKSEMDRFQTGGDSRNAPCLFLLSTRAGGLGINLVAADTVIFYDQDWNPQMDAQAQDRAHRIGQTKPVLIFRIVTAHTIETKIMDKASEKRQLEALVIAKATSLLRLEGEKIEVVKETSDGATNVISDEDLNTLLDRSPEVFTNRTKGWTSAGQEESLGNKKAAFAVYEAPRAEGEDVLADLLGSMDDKS